MPVVIHSSNCGPQTYDECAAAFALNGLCLRQAVPQFTSRRLDWIHILGALGIISQEGHANRIHGVQWLCRP